MHDRLSNFYERHDETSRLDVSDGRVEFVRTQELIRPFLTQRRMRILDVGGADGRHAEWLVADGHDVEIIDVLPMHVERAVERGFRAEVGDARSLERDTANYDAVLLLGPLYHLFQRTDRLAALIEARRVVKPGGVVVVAAINRLAVALDFLRQDVLDATELHQVRRIVETGIDDTHDGAVFYFHTTNELETEMREAGFDDPDVRGVEGPAFALLDRHWDAAHPWIELVTEIARLADSDPSTRGASAHLLCIALR